MFVYSVCVRYVIDKVSGLIKKGLFVLKLALNVHTLYSLIVLSLAYVHFETLSQLATLSCIACNNLCFVSLYPRIRAGAYIHTCTHLLYNSIINDYFLTLTGVPSGLLFVLSTMTP